MLHRGDNQLPGTRRTTRKVGNRENNDKDNSQIARLYKTDRSAILPGLCNVFRRLPLQFSRLVELPNRNVRNYQPKFFSELAIREKQSVDDLKEMLASPLTLALTRATGHCNLDIDAQDLQVRCVLPQQRPDRHDKPIGYWSVTLRNTEKKLATTHKECLSVVCAVLLLRPRLEENRVTVKTDH